MMMQDEKIKTTDVNLMMALQEMSGVHKCLYAPSQ